MKNFLTLAFLFFIGSVSGWIIELFFRKFLSSTNPEHKWINPGFCTGPYLPIYGCGLCLLYLIAQTENLILTENVILKKAVLFLTMAVSMTAIEYIAGVFSLKVTNVRLWDYSDEWGNIQGIICPKFSIIWACLGALYYFLIHPHILDALRWLAENYAFSFFIGIFFGVFIVDAAQSTHLMVKLKNYAIENGVILRYEALKAHIRKRNEEAKEKYYFFLPFRSEKPLSEHIKELRNSFETRKKKISR